MTQASRLCHQQPKLNPMRTEDGYIIHKCLNGDSAAFGFLVDKYKEAVYALAYSKLRHFHDAEDVTQEAFINAYRKLHTLKHSDSFLAWLYSITSNLCKMWIRSHSKRPDREFMEDQDPKIFDDSAMNSYREKQVLGLINEALDSLPEVYQQVLTLYYLGGMNSREIAKFLGISSVAVRQQLSRARAKLKEEALIMMSETFEQHQLQLGFTFRIVEMVKHIRIHPFPRAPWLPWGLSLATGAMLTFLGFMSFIPHLISFNPALIGSENSIEAKVLESGEIPVDVLKTSEVPIISSGDNDFNGRGGSRTAPTLRDALAFLFAPQAGEGKWTNKADMPTARSSLSTSVVNGKIYAIGGWDSIGKRVLSAVEEYDPKTDKWTKKADMPTPRHALSTSVVNGKIYAIGGVRFGVTPEVAVEEYDPKTDTWTKKANMPTGRWYLAAGVVNEKIYAIGGVVAGVAFSTVEEYDPKTDKWQKKADMPTARMSLSASVVNGKIYAIGGFGPLSTVEEYDPKTDTWSKKADMPTARHVFSTSVVNGKIYAIGGWAGRSLSTVEEYDPKTDIWSKKADMPSPNNGHSSNVVNGKIYVIGGGGVRGATVEEFDLGFADEGEEGQGVEAKGKHVTSWGKMKK